MKRSRLADVLDPESRSRKARNTRIGLRLAVCIGLAAMVLRTVPGLSPTLDAALAAGMLAVWAILAVEYAVRLVIAPLDARLGHGRPAVVRARWARSAEGIVDLAAVAPVLGATLAGADAHTINLAAAAWALKLVRYNPGIGVLGRVVRMQRRPLVSVFVLFGAAVLLAATFAYAVEGREQPEAFGSIPGALWWAVVTVTTTGYGDEVPISAAGRIVAGTVMLAGLAVFALLAGILASGFSDELRRREFLRSWDLVAHVPIFRDIDAVMIAEVARLLHPRDVSAGVTIFRRGQPGDCMFFVVSGEVEMRLEHRPVILGPGDFFGEIALVTGGPRTATAVALADTTLLLLDIADFRELLERQPELNRAIYGEAKRRMGAGDSPDAGGGGSDTPP